MNFRALPLHLHAVTAMAGVPKRQGFQYPGAANSAPEPDARGADGWAKALMVKQEGMCSWQSPSATATSAASPRLDGLTAAASGPQLRLLGRSSSRLSAHCRATSGRAAAEAQVDRRMAGLCCAGTLGAGGTGLHVLMAEPAGPAINLSHRPGLP